MRGSGFGAGLCAVTREARSGRALRAKKRSFMGADGSTLSDSFGAPGLRAASRACRDVIRGKIELETLCQVHFVRFLGISTQFIDVPVGSCYSHRVWRVASAQLEQVDKSIPPGGYAKYRWLRGFLAPGVRDH